MAKYVLWKAEEKWKAKGWGLPFGAQHENEHVLRGMMWADNYWLFRDNNERLICTVNDIIEELLDLDMEPKQESMWWTSTNKLRVGSRGKTLDRPFKEVFDVLGYITGNGKDFQSVERTTCWGLESWWRDKFIYRSRTD